ncbi:MAG TPA: S-4TM family putative pore-forming effector [Polyangiaceae bacterium]|jgi:hypothetical protein|nr:S-4TM family putative pore-forming effector [Polyangiaceae bacterium]
MNTICTEQNSDLQLDRLAAQRALYAQAKTIFGWHAFLSTVVAGALIFATLFFDWLKPYALCWGFALTALDILAITPWQKKLREKAALIQESFDCDVLGLPWQTIKGKPADHETVVEYAKRYREVEPSFDSLRNWYSTDACGIPLFLGRVVCQRANAVWDGKQRRIYARYLIGAVVVLTLLLLLLGIVRGMHVAELFSRAIAPLNAGIWMTLRQIMENHEAAGRLDKLKEHAGNLWKHAIDGATEGELATECRSLQSELFDHRKRTVSVFDWLYWRLRRAHEQQMQETAVQLVSELRAARGDTAD